MLASIQKVIKVETHPNADQLDILYVLGWQVVHKKGQFKEGDDVVYIETDTVLDAQRPEYAFLSTKQYRVRTITLRGVISQGLLFPAPVETTEGDDVSEMMGVSKFQKHIPGGISIVKQSGTFPSSVPKTDSERLQSMQVLFDMYPDVPLEATLKYDGMSSTYVNINGVFSICSRNHTLDPDTDNQWTRIYKKYDIATILFENEGLALQGEIVGPGCNGNHLGLKEEKLYLFDIYDVNKQEYLDVHTFHTFLLRYPQLKRAATISTNITLSETSINNFVNISEMKYANGSPAEGIVVKSLINIKGRWCNGGRIQFKVINPIFSLKYNE